MCKKKKGGLNRPSGRQELHDELNDYVFLDGGEEKCHARLVSPSRNVHLCPLN